MLASNTYHNSKLPGINLLGLDLDNLSKQLYSICKEKTQMCMTDNRFIPVLPQN